MTSTQLFWLAIALIGAWTVLMSLKTLCSALENAQARNQLKLDVLKQQFQMEAMQRNRNDHAKQSANTSPASWEDSIEIVDEDEAASGEHKQAA